MGAGKIRLITLIAVIVAVVAVEVLARAMVTAGICSAPAAILGARLLESALIALVVLLWQRSPAAIGLGKGDIVRGIRAGLAWSLVFGGAAAAAGTLLLAGGVDPLSYLEMPRSAFSGSLALYFLTGAVVAPFAEELFFRGVLYGFFRRWGAATGLVLTTVVFVGLHLPGASLPITQAVGGIVFCLAYEKEKSLLAPYVIHALGNAAIFGLSG